MQESPLTLPVFASASASSAVNWLRRFGALQLDGALADGQESRWQQSPTARRRPTLTELKTVELGDWYPPSSVHGTPLLRRHQPLHNSAQAIEQFQQVHPLSSHPQAPPRETFGILAWSTCS